MNWRDFFYFSKGERRAFTLLLFLITLSWILLLLKEENPLPTHSETAADRTEISSAAKSNWVGNEKNIPEKKENTHSTKKIFSSIGKKLNSPQKSYYASKRKREKYFSYPSSEKFPAGTLVELNTADTTTLKKVPGIGSTFARRIIKYRELLGGFYSINQLKEVYGMDSERYEALVPWFAVDTLHLRKLNVNTLPPADLLRHPYLIYQQVQILLRLRKQKSRLSGWENLLLLEEFSDIDRERLTPYLSFAPPS